MRVRKLEMYPVECIVRGYLTGSGWKEYKEAARSADRAAAEPARVRQAAGADLHPVDQGRDRRPRRERRLDRAAEIIGDRALLEELSRVSIEVYKRGAEQAAKHGILLATPSSSSATTPAPRSSSATRC